MANHSNDNSLREFADCAAQKASSVRDRIVAFLYYRAEATDIPEASAGELASDFKGAGLGTQNVTRLKKILSKNKYAIKVGKDKWRLRADRHDEVAQDFLGCINRKKPLPKTDSIIPFELVNGSRGYLEEVTKQLNGCYDIGFYDASGVMMRRLAESLIIEAFESKKIESKIKDSDGNYFMLEALINAVSTEKTITLGRNSKKGLRDVKWLGDQSAHNRRFLAKKPDIDRIQPNFRILIQELVSIANLVK